MDSKNRFQYRLEYWFVLGLFNFMRALPRRVGMALGRALGRLIGLIAASRSRLALKNMRGAFPDASEAQLKTWTRECWENLGQAVWEFAQIPSLTKEEYFSRVDVDGFERVIQSHALGKGLILFTAHYTNWEYTTQFVSLSDFPLAVIARRMKNPYVNDFVNRIRAHQKINVFMHKNAVRESIRWLKQGNVLGMLIDQRITDGGVKVPFFGRDAHTTTMPALLALRLGSPIHPVHCWREGDKIKLHVAPAMDTTGLSAKEVDIVALTARMNLIVESWVRARPPNWLWIHDRWK